MDNMNAGNAGKNVLNTDVEIKGNIKFAGELTFDGKLDGEIHTDGTLNLGESAVVNGNINAQSVVVRGKVNGNITAKEKIEIKAKAELFGDIRATKLAVEEGVTFVGKTEVNPNKISPAAPAARPVSAEASRAGGQGRWRVEPLFDAAPLNAGPKTGQGPADAPALRPPAAGIARGFFDHLQEVRAAPARPGYPPAGAARRQTHAQTAAGHLL